MERPTKRHGLGSFNLPDPPARPQNVESTEPRSHASTMEEARCCHSGCSEGYFTADGKPANMNSADLVALGWHNNWGSEWLCPDHVPPFVKQARLEKASNKTSARAEQAARPPRASATQQQLKARRKGVAIVIAILAVIVLIIIGGNSGGVGSNNASYKAGFYASVRYSGINLGGSNASYTCGQLWTQVSRNYNQGDWMSGCKDGINS